MRKLAWFTAGFAGACLVCSYGAVGLYRPLLPALSGLVLAGLSLRLALFEEKAPLTRGLAVLRRGIALCLGGAAAAGWLWGWTALLRAPAEALAGQTLEVSATVASYPASTSTGGYRMTVELDAPHADVQVYAGEGWGGVRPGDVVTFTARLTAADTIRGEETTYHTAKGIFLLGYVSEPPLHAERPARLPPRFWPTLCAKRLQESLASAFDGETAPLAAALVTGDKSGLSEGLSACMSRTGTAHAAVVSGMHVSSLVALFLILTRRRRRLAAIVLPILFFYALMTGGAPSAIRAVLMQGVLLLAPFAKREYDPPTALAFALLLLLLHDPYAAGSVSLQLSFTSVAGILTVTPRLLERWTPAADRVRERLPGRGGKILAGAVRLALSSLAVSFGGVALSQPVLAFYFGRVSLIFPLANLLILPAVQALLPGALLTGTTGLLLPGAARVLGGIFGVLGRYIIGVVTLLGRWRWASVDVGEPCWLLFAVALWLAPALYLLPEPRRPRAAVPAVCLAALFAGALVCTRLPVSTALLTVTALDVGQGASTALLSGGRTCLVDCGGNGSDSAGDIAADYFAAMGAVRLDLLVLTHFDKDHVNGLPRLFDRMEVEAVAYPETGDGPARESLLALAEAEGAQMLPIRETVRRGLGDGVVTLYPPLGGGTSNEAGLFALCSAEDVDVLVTGDADGFVEKMLIKYYDVPDLELLVAGHHGSASSTSAELLDALRPEVALISVGRNNYGHPSEEVLSRLASRGIDTLRTDELGTVRVYIDRTENGYAYRVDAG